MDAGTVSSFTDEMGDAGKNERAALKYSSLEGLPGKIKNPDKQSPYGRQILKGQEVEKEHKGTIGWLKKNPDAPLLAATRSIADEHVEEDPLYYDHLNEMERKYKKAQVSGFFDELGQIKVAMGKELYESMKSLPLLQRPSRLLASHLASQPATQAVKQRIGGIASHLKDVPDVWTSAAHL